MLCVWSEWSMHGNDIGGGKECVKICPCISVLSVASGGRIIDYICTECLCNICDPSSDIAKSDNSPGLSMNLAETLCKMGKNGVVNVAFPFYIIIVVSALF